MGGPSEFSASTGGASPTSVRLACDALRSQRQRWATLMPTLADGAWQAQSRCSAWSVHEVLRHLSDTTLRSTAILDGASPADQGAEHMDPRTTPLEWMSRSQDETPRDTVTVLAGASAEVLAAVDRRLAGDAPDVHWLYGDAPWSLGVLHVFWDGWLHERDILLPLGLPHASPAVESRAAATYGFLMAALPTLAAGGMDETVDLAGDGGGLFEVVADASTGRALTLAGMSAAGTVTISVGGPSRRTDPMRGDLAEVVDFLAGRGGDTPLEGPAERVQWLSLFRMFLLAPA